MPIPFVEPSCRNHTSAMAHAISEYRLLQYGFHLGINQQPVLIFSRESPLHLLRLNIFHSSQYQCQICRPHVPCRYPQFGIIYLFAYLANFTPHFIVYEISSAHVPLFIPCTSKSSPEKQTWSLNAGHSISCVGQNGMLIQGSRPPRPAHGYQKRLLHIEAALFILLSVQAILGLCCSYHIQLEYGDSTMK